MKNVIFLTLLLGSVSFAEKAPCTFTTDEHQFESKKVAADFELLNEKLAELGCTFVDKYKTAEQEKYQIYTYVSHDYDHPVSKGDWKTPTEDSVVLGVLKKSDNSFPFQLKERVGKTGVFGRSYERQVHHYLEDNIQNIVDTIAASEQKDQ